MSVEWAPLLGLGLDWNSAVEAAASSLLDEGVGVALSALETVPRPDLVIIGFPVVDYESGVVASTTAQTLQRLQGQQGTLLVAGCSYAEPEVHQEALRKKLTEALGNSSTQAFPLRAQVPTGLEAGVSSALRATHRYRQLQNAPNLNERPRPGWMGIFKYHADWEKQ